MKMLVITNGSRETKINCLSLKIAKGIAEMHNDHRSYFDFEIYDVKYGPELFGEAKAGRIVWVEA
jgi:hypothetical protein